MKSSVYAIPASEDALEDLRWLLHEIVREGGEGSVAEAVFVDGATESLLVERFREVSSAAYLELAREATHLRTAVEDDQPTPVMETAAASTKAKRLRNWLDDVKQADFFHAEGRDVAERAVAEVADALMAGARRVDPGGRAAEAMHVASGRTWVTRRGVKVDRIASAWLIKRFIDPRARFVFVDPEAYTHVPGSLRFDMFEGEFTHEGTTCTFETLLSRFGLEDPALRALGEIVHDIDCKDEAFGRPETPGVAATIDGLVRGHADDQTRLTRGSALLDALLEHMRSRLP